MASKETLILLGSPRADGNSDRLALHLAEQLRAAGAAVETVALRDLAYSGCRNLFHCKTASDRCGLEDGLTAVLDKVRTADNLVVAAPVYFTDVPSGVKAVIDRFFSFFVPDYPTAEVKSRLRGGKSFTLIQVQGETGGAYADLLTRYEKGLRMLGFGTFHHIHAQGVRNPGDLDDRLEIWAEVDALSRTLIQYVSRLAVPIPVSPRP